jgi:hypothetical protein
LDVVLHQKYGDHWYGTRMEINLLDGVAKSLPHEMDRSLIMDLDRVEASYKEEVLEKIYIPVTPWVVTSPSEQVYFESPTSGRHWYAAAGWRETWASVRLRISNGFSTRTTPNKGQWLRFNMTKDSSAAALDHGKWVADPNVMNPPTDS